MKNVLFGSFFSVLTCFAAFFGVFFATGEAGAAGKRPNVMIISAGSLGFSDLGCYGGEILTPNLDALAAKGLQFTQFYHCGATEMTLSALLTGQYPHRVGMGYPDIDLQEYSYRGSMNDATATIAEFLRTNGYQTLAAGKWPVTLHHPLDAPRFAWPGNRGVERFYGTILAQSSYFDTLNVMMNGATFPKEKDFYYTDAVGREAGRFLEAAKKAEKPFFLHVSFTAPSWPLQAPEADIQKYARRYNGGWEMARANRFAKMKENHVVPSSMKMSPQDPNVVAWSRLGPYQPWQARRMEVYAAQVSAMDRAVGVILESLRKMGLEENTLIIFISDAGACATELTAEKVAKHPAVLDAKKRKVTLAVGNDPRVMPGGPLTFQSYGVPWANVSNTPFRGYSRAGTSGVYEGAIASPCIVSWPAGIPETGKVSQPVHVVDIFPTVVEVSQYVFPKELNGRDTLRPVGESWVPLFSRQNRMDMAADEKRKERFLFWEVGGNIAVRYGKWKLVWTRDAKQWELYNMVLDRTEQTDVYGRFRADPEVQQMVTAYDAWARASGVKQWKTVQALHKKLLREEAEKKAGAVKKKAPADEDAWEDTEQE